MNLLSCSCMVIQMINPHLCSLQNIQQSGQTDRAHPLHDMPVASCMMHHARRSGSLVSCLPLLSRLPGLLPARQLVEEGSIIVATHCLLGQKALHREPCHSPALHSVQEPRMHLIHPAVCPVFWAGSMPTGSVHNRGHACDGECVASTPDRCGRPGRERAIPGTQQTSQMGRRPAMKQ